MKERNAGFTSTFETPLSGGLRFAVELLAWVAGPWAMVGIAWWLAIPSVAVLVGLPAVFSTVGDKKHVFIPTPGPLRFALELVLYGVAAAAPWFVWPLWAAIVVDVVVVASLVVGVKRTRWLLSGAPRV
jgi:hypothetical protein